MFFISQSQVISAPKEFQMEHKMLCQACGSADFQSRITSVTDYLYGTPGSWSLYECIRCQTLQLSPMPSLEEIPEFYNSYFTHTKSELGPSQGRSPARNYIIRNLRRAFEENDLAPRIIRAFIRFSAPRTAQNLARSYAFISRGKQALDILDFGCGDGALISRLSQLGHRTVGVDFDQKALAVCESRGLSVYQASTLDELEPSHFDIITCLNVIEHVPDPNELMQRLRRLLKPEGTLLIETPNARSLLAQWLGAAWRGLEAPRHLNVFSTAGITNLLERNGFSIHTEHFVPCADFIVRSSNIEVKAKRRLRSASPLLDFWQWLNPACREVHFFEVKPRLRNNKVAV